jgi:hypothetical protein
MEDGQEFGEDLELESGRFHFGDLLLDELLDAWVEWGFFEE